MLLFLFVKSFQIFYLPEAALSIYNIQVLSVVKIHTDQAFDDLKLETQQLVWWRIKLFLFYPVRKYQLIHIFILCAFSPFTIAHSPLP